MVGRPGMGAGAGFGGVVTGVAKGPRRRRRRPRTGGNLAPGSGYGGGIGLGDGGRVLPAPGEAGGGLCFPPFNSINLLETDFNFLVTFLLI